MNNILCHECKKPTFMTKQLVGGEMRSCPDGHKGLYNSKLEFVRPAPVLDHQPPPPPPPPAAIAPVYQPRPFPTASHSMRQQGDINIICPSCKDPTNLAEARVKINIKCAGCNGSGYYYDDSRGMELICDGCDGDGKIEKTVDKRLCLNGHVCFYKNGKFFKAF